MADQLRAALLDGIDAIAGKPAMRYAPGTVSAAYENGWNDARAECHRIVRDALEATPERDTLGRRALEAIAEWSRRYNGQFSYADQHDFVRERFDPIAEELRR